MDSDGVYRAHRRIGKPQASDENYEKDQPRQRARASHGENLDRSVGMSLPARASRVSSTMWGVLRPAPEFTGAGAEPITARLPFSGAKK